MAGNHRVVRVSKQVIAVICLIFPIALTSLAATVDPASPEMARVQRFYPAAKAGDKEAEFQLGLAYWALSKTQGTSVQEAFKWYRKAADDGQAQAEFVMSEQPMNMIDAMQWAKKSADHGFIPAQTRVGSFILFALSPSLESVPGCSIDIIDHCDLKINDDTRRYLSFRAKGILDTRFDEGIEARKTVDWNILKEQLILWSVFGFFAAFILILVFGSARVALRPKPPSGMAAELDEFRTEAWSNINARFPWTKFPRISRNFAAYLTNRRPSAIEPIFEDDSIQTWAKILAKYPKPPLTDEDRKAREKQFWSDLIQRHIVHLSDGTAGLTPKQQIIDYWWSFERWIFREYYAATGVFIDSFFTAEFLDAAAKRYGSPYFRELGRKEVLENRIAPRNLKRAAEKNLPSYAKDPAGTGIPRVMAGYLDAMTQRAAQVFSSRLAGIEAHKERWGEWYFLNIVQAFQQAHGDPIKDDVDSQKAHGDARLATEAEATAAAAGGVRRSSVHDQEF